MGPWRACVAQDFFDQSLDEIKLLKYINVNGDVDYNNVLRTGTQSTWGSGLYYLRGLYLDSPILGNFHMQLSLAASFRV